MLQNNNFIPVCEQALEFNLRLDEENGVESQFGTLQDAVEISKAKIESICPTFEASIEALQDIKVRVQTWLQTNLYNCSNYFKETKRRKLGRLSRPSR
jgi:hypothetical protein